MNQLGNHTSDRQFEERLKRLCAQMRQQRTASEAAQTQPSVDYALLARVADGTATPEEHVAAQALLHAHPGLKAAFDSHVSHPQALSAPRRPLLRFSVVLKSTAWLAAACLLICIPLLWLHMRRPPHPCTFRNASTTPPAWSPVRSVRLTTYDIEAGTYAPHTVDVYQAAYALLIGIDAYDYQRTGFDALRHSVSDVRALERELRGFQFSGIFSLTDRCATRRNILEKLRELMERAGPDGSLFVYFAGHGYQDPDRPDVGYLIPYDGSRDAAALPARNIALDAIKQLARDCNVRHVYLVIDSCYAGLVCMRSGPPAQPAVPDFHYVRELARNPVVSVLAASGAQQPAVDGLFGTIFRQTLAKFSRRPFVTGEMLNDAVKRAVRTAALIRYHHQQTPVSARLRDTRGDYIFVPTGAVMNVTAPYVTNVAVLTFPDVIDCRYLFAADLDGDGEIEFVSGSAPRARVFTAAGHIRAQRPLRREASVVLTPNLAGVPELFLYERRGTVHVMRALGPDLRPSSVRITYPGYAFEKLVPANTPSMRPEYHRLCTNRWYREYGYLGFALLADINRDFCREVIVSWYTGYAPYPRALLVFDYATGKLLWRHETAPFIGLPDIHYDPYQRRSLLLSGTYAPFNGRVAADGTTDSNSYIMVFNDTGQLQWRQMLGGHYTRASAKFVDMNRDGHDEILAFLTTHTWPRGVIEQGDISLWDLHGRQLALFSNTSSVESVIVYPHYQTGENYLLAALRNGQLVMLDARLRELRRLSFETSAPTVTVRLLRQLLTEHYGTNVAATLLAPDLAADTSAPLTRIQDLIRQYYALFHNRTNVVTDYLPLSPELRICGFMRTAFGEFVVVLYHERYTAMVNVMEPIAGPRSVHVFFNTHIKLLDKVTLQERLRVPMDDCPLNEYQSQHVQLADVDQDGQDELILLLKDCVKFFKVTAE